MQLHATDITAYSYCPVLQKHKSHVKSSMPALSARKLDPLVKVLTYVFSRWMEKGKVPTWDVWSGKFIRIFWKNRELKDAAANALSDGMNVMLSQLFGWAAEMKAAVAMVNFEFYHELNDGTDRVLSSIPAVHITDDENIELTFWDVPADLDEFRRHMHVRLGVAAVNQFMPTKKIVAVHGLHFDIKKFEVVCHTLYPTDEYIANADRDVKSIVAALKNDIVYPNIAGCKKCRISKRCDR